MYLVSAGKHIQGIRLANGVKYTNYHDCGQQCSHASHQPESHLNKSLRTPNDVYHHVISGGISGQGKGAEHVRLASTPSLRRGISIIGSSAKRGTHHNVDIADLQSVNN